MLSKIRKFTSKNRKPNIVALPSVRGRIDQCDENVIRGWVCDFQHGEKVQVRIFSGEKSILNLKADKFRQDLADASIGDGFCAFSADLGAILTDGKRHQIKVEAETSDGRRFSFEPIFVDAKFSVNESLVLDGRLDNPLPGRIRGWVMVKDRPDVKPFVEIKINDHILATVCANKERLDVKEKVGGDGRCGFEYPIPFEFVNGCKHKLTAKVVGETKFVFNAKEFSQLPHSGVAVEATKILPRVRKDGFRGNVDRPNRANVIRGWACIGDEYRDNGSEISIYIDGVRAGTTVAKIFRKDLEEHGINSGYAGFEYSVPQNFIDGRKHEVEIRDESGDFFIASRKIELKNDREYTDFEGYLKWSFFNREVPAPFREEDKRCFAYMDWLEKFDSKRYSRQLEGKNAPLVTIVMPTYNRAHIIGRAVQSVLAQSYFNWELIVIDDGSSDNTSDVIAAFGDDRIRYVRLDGNLGVSHARNHGLTIAKGEYIAYLDTDNDWRENFLLLVVGNLEEKRDYDCAYTAQYLYRNEQSQPCAVRFGPFNRTLLENRNYIDMNAFVHRRSIFDRLGGFDTKLRRLVDWDLVLRYSEDKKPLAISNIVSNYYYYSEGNAITITEDLASAKSALSQSRSLGREEFVLEYDEIGYRGDGEEASSPVTSSQIKSSLLSQKCPVSVIVVSFNIPKIFRACIESVLRTTDPELTEIIIIDNCSDSETIEVVRELSAHKNVKSVFNELNLGFTAAVNQGIELAQYSNDIILLNNDAIATSGWVQAMQDVVERYPDAGIVCPQQVLFPNTKTLNTHVPYADPNCETDVSVSYHHKNLELAGLLDSAPEFEVNFVPFFCVYIPRSVIREVGLLDEKLGRHYRSDRLYCYAVRYQGGKKVYFTPKSKLYHLHQQSTSSLKKKDKEEFEVMFVKNSWSQDFPVSEWDF
ncbi:glycosyltransferase [Microbulbifer sp. YPW1]|uniref:glycosyltransferase n=1 Tax=Microbulbifer sp. YPW1 TaxID=2745199 RepID=UPI00159A0F80|nr:glycosyltransferase [Microbulbifer sp. YPW1]QKX15831.1 glycosyltransferase [Microbulbifer sp. YPW1]